MDVPDRIEHSVLGPTTSWADVRTVLDEATEDGMRACIPPRYVVRADDYAEVPLTTVIDFPHGQGATEAVAAAASTAWEDGADEIDMVCNVGELKAGADAAVRETIAEVVATVPIPVKVIVEAPLLSDGEKHRAGEIVADAGADFLKTATGFSAGGATVADVELLAKYRPVKASGGIGSWAEAKAMFEAGAERIGASSGVEIVEEWRAAQAVEGSGPAAEHDGEESGPEGEQ